MRNLCVVAAEGARARFFTLESSSYPEMEGGPDLVECESLANPRHRAHHDRIYADARGGRNRTSVGVTHGYDEHRDGFDAELGHRFAREIASGINELCRRNGAQRVILCAEKRMLGHLREALNGGSDRLEITEVAKDLAKLSSRELQKHLARDGLVPARRAPG